MARTATKTRKDAKSREQRAAELEALVDQLTTWRDSLNDDDLERYAARFDTYSLRNALLIVMQDPDATVVHGYHDWRKHGRQVTSAAKGHGIRILAYAGSSDTPQAQTEGDDAGTGEGGKARMHFRYVTVFDVRFTEPIETAGEVATEAA